MHKRYMLLDLKNVSPEVARHLKVVCRAHDVPYDTGGTIPLLPHHEAFDDLGDNAEIDAALERVKVEGMTHKRDTGEGRP